MKKQLNMTITLNAGGLFVRGCKSGRDFYQAMKSLIVPTTPSQRYMAIQRGHISGK